MGHLGMGPDIVATSTASPAARNRYIYYPDHLVRMPGPVPGAGLLRNLFSNFSTLFTEPLFKGTIRGMLAEPAVDPRPPAVEDESVGAFIKRRFGKPMTENLVSAFLHGIYAGNLYKLSARTLFPQLWHLETMDTGIVGSLFDNMWNGRSLVSYEQLNFLVQMSHLQMSQLKPPRQQLADVLTPLTGASVYTFKRGLGQLIARLESVLRDTPNVTIKTDTNAHSMHFERETKTIALATTPSSGEEPIRHDYVVSTIPPNALIGVMASPSQSGGANASPVRLISALSDTAPSSVNVMVVNLFYSDPNLLPYRGFGYLLPRSMPLEQNPERALGVIFGSETSTSDQRVVGKVDLDMGSGEGRLKPEDVAKAFAFAEEEAKATPRPAQDSAKGTKLTVMLGGHWWEGWDPDTDLPNEESAIQMARSLLERHLGITGMPIVAKARLARNAIPQYQVGYHRAMGMVHENLLQDFGGRLKVAGSAFQGAVGVNDCVRAATSLALGLKEGWDGDGKTGLEGFKDGDGMEIGKERWIIVDRSGEVLRESVRGKQD
jgi:oxygen-dependent protoporphyrinogen oxidase